jgi:ribonuclease J
LGLVAFSAQNIDRLVTVYKATRASGRTLVIDPYQARLVESLANPRLPVPAWGIRVVVPRRQRPFAGPYGHARIHFHDLARHPERFVLTFRAGMRAQLEASGCLSGATMIHSLWAGYLKQPGDTTIAWCRANDIPLAVLHTSGHASVKDLQLLCTTLRPKRLVPIHTDAPARFAEWCQNLGPLQDLEWMEVADVPGSTGEGR